MDVGGNAGTGRVDGAGAGEVFILFYLSAIGLIGHVSIIQRSQFIQSHQTQKMFKITGITDEAIN